VAGADAASAQPTSRCPWASVWGARQPRRRASPGAWWAPSWRPTPRTGATTVSLCAGWRPPPRTRAGTCSAWQPRTPEGAVALPTGSPRAYGRGAARARPAPARRRRGRV